MKTGFEIVLPLFLGPIHSLSHYASLDYTKILQAIIEASKSFFFQFIHLVLAHEAVSNLPLCRHQILLFHYDFLQLFGFKSTSFILRQPNYRAIEDVAMMCRVP